MRSQASQSLSAHLQSFRPIRAPRRYINHVTTQLKSSIHSSSSHHHHAPLAPNPIRLAAISRSNLTRPKTSIQTFPTFCEAIGARFSSTGDAPNLRYNPTSSIAPTPRPTTSVNAASRVPEGHRALYDALSLLEHDAASYVSLARLKLTLSSLQRHGLVRIAILQLTDQYEKRKKTPGGVGRKVVQAVLADVLGTKALWENELEEESEKAILVRYGSNQELAAANSVFRTVYAQSSLLRKNNVEIIISEFTSIEAGSAVPSPDGTAVLDQVFVPRLETAASAHGGISAVGYPVHKALIVGQSLRQLVTFGSLIGSSGMKYVNDGTIRMVYNRDDGITSECKDDDVSAISVNTAMRAIDIFRASPARSSDYQHDWEASGLGNVQAWLDRASAPTQQLKPAIKQSIDLLLEHTLQNISMAERDLQLTAAREAILPKTRTCISNSIDEWAENAHRELQTSLDGAFESREWRKIEWWKLPWRIDQVSMIMTDLIAKAWLTNAEKGTISLAGRVQEAGLFDRKAWEVSHWPTSPLQSAPVPVSLQPSSPKLSIPLPRSSDPDAAALSDQPPDLPYLQHMSSLRSNLIATTIPPIHRLAQRLLVSSLSTTALTAALSALLYVSFPLTPVVDAAAIAALGFVVAARLLQVKWQTARGQWQTQVREQGRQALVSAETSLRYAVQHGACDVVDKVLEDELLLARRRVDQCRAALERMG